MARPKSVIVGVGNPMLSDDAVGLAAARQVYERVTDPDVEFIEAAVGGFELAEMLVGYDRALIIDAIQTDGGRTGDCYAFDLAPAAAAEWPASSHRIGLAKGLALARIIGMEAPRHVRVYAIEAEDTCTFSTELTDALKAALPGIVEDILVREFGVAVPDRKSSAVDSA
jgi:hydrogenase maturation protease